jgi:hypothetical protein
LRDVSVSIVDASGPITWLRKTDGGDPLRANFVHFE